MIITHGHSNPRDRDIRTRAMSAKNGPDWRIKLELGTVTIYLSTEDAVYVAKMLEQAVDDALRTNDIAEDEHTLHEMKVKYAELG